MYIPFQKLCDTKQRHRQKAVNRFPLEMLKSLTLVSSSIAMITAFQDNGKANALLGSELTQSHFLTRFYEPWI